jgi:P27 family predicted phage terminase small subunit
MPNHPVPTERKRARGNPGKTKLPSPTEVIEVEPLEHDAPIILGPAGRDMWLKMNASAHWLGESDSLAVMMLCQKADRRQEILDRLETEPLVLVPENGSRAQPNPLVTMLDQVEKDMVTLLSLLGMTPTDRSRLGLAEVKKQSTLEKLRAQRASK